MQTWIKWGVVIGIGVLIGKNPDILVTAAKAISALLKGG